MQRLTIGELPPPLSSCFTNIPKKGRVPTNRYKKWTADALIEIMSQRPRNFTGEVSIWIGLVAPDKRHRDAGNLDKALGDVLVKSGVIVDDSNKYVRRLSYEWISSGAPVTILVQEYEGSAE